MPLLSLLKLPWSLVPVLVLVAVAVVAVATMVAAAAAAANVFARPILCFRCITELFVCHMEPGGALHSPRGSGPGATTPAASGRAWGKSAD